MLSIWEQWEDFGNSHRLQGKEDFRWKEYCDFTVVCNGSILVYENYPQKGKKNKNSNYVKEKLNSATVGAGYCSCMRRWRLCPRHSSPLWDTEQDLSQNLEHVGEQAFQEEITEMKPLSKLALGMQMGWLSSSLWSLGICRMSAGNSTDGEVKPPATEFITHSTPASPSGPGQVIVPIFLLAAHASTSPGKGQV